MKKFILTLLAFIVAICCAFGAIACGDGGSDNSGNSGNTDNTDNSGNDDNSGNNGNSGDNSGNSGNEGNGGNSSEDGNKTVLTEDTDFDALVSDKLTEEEWNAVFTDENFWNVTLKTFENGDSMPWYIHSERTATRAAYIVTTGRGGDGSNAVLFENNILQVLYKGKDDENWTCMVNEDITQGDYSQEEIEQIKKIYFSLEIVTCDFSNKYSKFTYDEEKGVYVGENISVSRTPFEAMSSTLTYVELKFVDGRLASILDGEVDSYYYNYYDYGTTVAEIPEVSEPGIELTEDTDFDALVSDKLTEDEWNEVFTDENFWNVTLKSRFTNADYYDYIYSQRTETRVLYNNELNNVSDGEDPEFSAVLIEDNIISISVKEKDGTWECGFIEEIDEEYIEEFGSVYWSLEIVTCNFSGYYSNFTYDEEKGAYIYDGDGLTVEGNELLGWHHPTFDYVELKFKNGHLASFVWHRVGEEETYTYLFYDYGTTVAEMPLNATTFGL